MNNFMVYSLFMMIMSIYFVMMSMNLYFGGFSLLYEWMIYSVNSINVEIILLVDWISILFISFILMISSMVMLFSCSYMELEKFMNRFMLLVNLFIFSMILMIISPNIISILFGWDGLGLVSYCLVIYYQNFSSYNSGMVTVLMNRVGDIGLLMAIGLVVMKGSWNNFFLSDMNLVVLMILIAAITKSAQIPFSSWLPMAMAAPTPVSALVHSSTLVTAGVYLLIRFNNILMESFWSDLLMYLSVVTMFMAGMVANVENDMKKIIALSTLSQLGLMMMILSMGMSMLALFHLLTHAIFKSLLFLCAGAIIHSMNNNQDIRFYGNLNEFLPYVMNGFYISSISLSGFPFLSGFYSKDLIMEMMYYSKLNLVIYLMIVMSLIFTVSYSFRMIYYVYFGEMNMVSSSSVKENFIMDLSMFILILMSVIVGAALMWMFFIDLKFIYLDFSLKMLTLSMCLFGVMLGSVIYVVSFKKLYYSMLFISMMWYLNYMFCYIYKPVMLIGVNMWKVDLMWFEYVSKKFLVNLMIQLIKSSFNSNSKMYMYIYIFVLAILYLNL